MMLQGPKDRTKGKYVHECVFSLCKAPVLKTKALTPDLFFLGAAGSQTIVHMKLRKGSMDSS